MKLRLLVSICLFVYLPCSAQAASNWVKIYRHDKAGEATQGQKQDLINAIRLGVPIRFGTTAQLAKPFEDYPSWCLFPGLCS